MRLDADALRSGLAGKRIGWPLHCFETVDSTNRVAMRLAREGAAEGTAVLADGQTDGKGRLRRGWQSPPGCNLYLSVILRPALAVPEISRITLLAGVAAAETIASACPQGGVGIKWPNDVRIRGRKACGILAETSPAGGSQVVVLGIGWILGGTLGVGTVVYALAIGPLVQLLMRMDVLVPTAPQVRRRAEAVVGT